jgi:hypothetical protein
MSNVTDRAKAHRGARAFQRMNAPENLRRQLAPSSTFRAGVAQTLEIALQTVDNLASIGNKHALLFGHGLASLAQKWTGERKGLRVAVSYLVKTLTTKRHEVRVISGDLVCFRGFVLTTTKKH